ncbi:hypothetical protein D3C83_246070 [compost metagenome]
MQGLKPREAFARLNNDLPPESRFRHLGVVHAPCVADVYAPPERDEDSDEA